MMKQSYLINRRHVLRGTGTALALPLLDIMAPAVQARPANKPPIRLGVLYKGNGVHPPSWDISGTSETDFEFSPLVKPLESIRDEVLFLSNLDHIKGGWSHQSCAVAFLGATGSNGKNIDRRQPETIDQLIGRNLANQTPLSSLELTCDGIFLPEPITSYISFDQQGRAVPRESDPQIVFDRMFRNINDGSSKSRNLSILDVVLEDANRLKRQGSTDDQRKLAAYLESVRSVERQLTELGEQTADERFSPTTPPELNRPVVSDSFPARVKALMDMMVLAFWTDTTRVSSFLMANSSSRIVFDFLGINEEHHYLSHFVRNAGTKYITHFNMITQWHVEQFKYLAQRLASIEEEGERLLDNTMLMFGSSMKHGDYHSGRDLPIILAGGKNAGIKTGRWLKYPDAQPYGNLLTGLAQRMGVDATDFGSSTASLEGLDRTMNYDFGVKDTGNWLAIENGATLEFSGLVRPTTDLEKTNVYFIRLSDGTDVKLDASFRNLNGKRIDHYVGRVAKITGPFKRTGEQFVVTNIDTIEQGK
tara:strand:- start:19053 stop:20651 length:1599 start_codon:yes stop_codon:yes gene_type:complete